MRVCLVAPELMPVPPVRGGAIETGIAGVAPELAGLGADVHVISMSDPLLQPTSIPLGSGRLTYHSVDIPQPLRRFPIDVIARGAYYFPRRPPAPARGAHPQSRLRVVSVLSACGPALLPPCVRAVRQGPDRLGFHEPVRPSAHADDRSRTRHHHPQRRGHDPVYAERLHDVPS